MPVYPIEFSNAVHNAWRDRLARLGERPLCRHSRQFTQFTVEQLRRAADNYALLAEQTNSVREKHEYLDLQRLYNEQAEDALWRENAESRCGGAQVNPGPNPSHS